MAVAGNTDTSFTKSMLFLDVEAAIPTILGLPLKLEAKGTAVVSAVENKDPVLFFGPVTFNYLGNRKISAVVEIASRFGVDSIFAENQFIISRNTLYTPSQSGTMQVLNTGL
uniref:Uncharacterized protein LOC116300683 n=1 Tax=Actinia tenebrosa TaxID=6105 RepID=A0A6P8IFJ3_ACTTE